MNIKTVLAIIQSNADAKRVLDFALPFASRQNSHVIGLHAEALPIIVTAPIGAPVVYETGLLRDAEARQAELRKFFDERCQAEGVAAAEWRSYESVSGDSAISGIESARTADLVIAQQNDPSADARSTANVEALVFESGRPVLLVPYSFEGRSKPCERILLAWNGSQQAARAAFDALPLMKEAGKVEVLIVDARDSLQQDASVAGTAIAAALARHDLDVTIRNEQTGSGQTHADIITRRLADIGADLLVMGAYGRSRLSEFVFGGVTRSMLKSMTTPTLMSR